MIPGTIASQLTAIVAEVAITTLGAIALTQGQDGAIFAACIGALAGLGGYQLRTTTNAINNQKKQPPVEVKL
jgi:hypothetical protein